MSRSPSLIFKGFYYLMVTRRDTVATWATRMSTDDKGEARAQRDQFQGLKITHSEGRWLPTIRSRESYEQALKGDCQLLGERVRLGTVSHDEREFLDDLINRRIKPGKGLYNQRRAQVRRKLVADFVSKMKRKHPTMQLKAIVDEAKKHFGIARTEVFNSIREHESNEVE
jgi:hypothetical protein